MRKSVTPVFGILLLVLFSISSIGLTYAWMTGVNTGIQETVGEEVSECVGPDCSRLQIVSFMGDCVTISNIGCNTVDNVTIIIDEVLTGYGFSEPLLPDSSTIINYPSLEKNVDHCIIVVLPIGVYLQECSSAHNNVEESGYS